MWTWASPSLKFMGREVTITCASHMLLEMEHHYLAVEKEALGCLWAVEQFEKYLLGLSCRA